MAPDHSSLSGDPDHHDPATASAEESPSPVTLALIAARQGDRGAMGEAFGLVYDEVRRLARERLDRQGARGTLDTTAVVHEAFMKIARHGDMQWEDRRHFLAVSAVAVRQVLLDHARKHLTTKRGGGATHVPLDEAKAAAAASSAQDLVALDIALTRLSEVDPQLGSVVELRFFGGLSVEETALTLEVSEATVKRAWRKARAILHRELGGEAELA